MASVIESIGRDPMQQVGAQFDKMKEYALEQIALIEKGEHPYQEEINALREEQRAKEEAYRQQVAIRGQGRNGLPEYPDQIAKALTHHICKLVESRGRTYEPTRETNSAIARVSKWLAYSDTAPFLIVSGNVGSGKTTISKAIAITLRQAPNSQIAALSEPRSMVYAPMIEEVTAEEVWRQYNPKEDSEYSGIIGRLSVADFVLLDDLGLEEIIKNDYGTKHSPLRMLLTRRAENYKPTIITTNLKGQDDWVQHCGERLFDRICEVSETVVMVQHSFRQNRAWRSTKE